MWFSQCYINNEQNEGWNPYSDIENQLIEDAYTKKEQEQFQLADYTIDFKQMIEIRQDDYGCIQQKLVKREESEFIRDFKTERFCCTEGPKLVTSFSGTHFWGSEFISNWRQRNEELWYDGLRWTEIEEQAAGGYFYFFTISKNLVFFFEEFYKKGSY